MRLPAPYPISRAVALACLLAAAIPATTSGQQTAVHSPHGVLDPTLDCSDCHTATAWAPVRDTMEFSHSELGGFDLDGAHGLIRCVSCHVGLRFDEPDVRQGDCGACHEDVHQGTLDPLCDSCHNTRSFTDVQGVEIHMRTGFPLEGAHLQITCESCHTDDRGGAFSPLDSECFACHLEDYESAQSVDHVGGNVPIECLRCHTPLGWNHDVIFDHEEVAGGYPLVGIHGHLPCAACHIPPGNQLIFDPASPDDCLACHEADYLREHGGTGFPIECAACHSQTRWSDVTFDHDGQFFPINSGSHQGRWDACQDCHVVPGNLSVYSCIVCHTAGDTNQDHDEVPDYVFEDSACLSCHPDGS
jgi:hypothetical protein